MFLHVLAPPTLPAGPRNRRRLRRDAALAVRPPWQEVVALLLTAALVLSVPSLALLTLQAGRRMDQAEAAATTVADLAPRAEQVGAATAEVARRLADLADTHGPLLVDVADGVNEVVADVDAVTDRLEPLAGALGRLAPALRRLGADEAGDGLDRARAALVAVDEAVDDVAAATDDAARHVALLSAPETIALLEEAADRIDQVATLSRTAGDLAEGYVAEARTYRLVGQLATVVALAVTVAWLVWRVREHRRWQQLRRAGAADRVLGALTAG